MINLKEIEQEIDNLLGNETTDSLREWFSNQQTVHIEKYIGDGEYLPLVMPDEFFVLQTFPKEAQIVEDCGNSNVTSDNHPYGMAA